MGAGDPQSSELRWRNIWVTDCQRSLNVLFVDRGWIKGAGRTFRIDLLYQHFKFEK